MICLVKWKIAKQKATFAQVKGNVNDNVKENYQIEGACLKASKRKFILISKQ